MVLDFEYGINTGNRFLDLVDHDEDPEELIASQAHAEEKPKKSTKDSKAASSAATTKKTTSKTTSSTTASTSNAGTGAAKTNKENLAGKSMATDQRRPQSNTFGDSNNQQPRTDSARGGGRGFPRRGSSGAGQERPAYEGGGRGGGQQRTQRFNKFEGQQTSGEAGAFDQGGDVAGNDADNNNQRYGGYRGRGRGGDRGGGDRGGRGTFYNRNYEGGRGSGRGRGRGGRGGFNNRSFEEGSQQQQQQQQQQPSETNEWQQNTEASFDTARPRTARTGDQDFEADAPLQDRSFEPDGNRRGGRGHFRARTFHNNRTFGHDRPGQYEREGGEGGQDDYRHNRRLHDRQPRSLTSGVKPIEKKDGEGAHNWGNVTEIPDETVVTDELAEATDAAAPAAKNWSEQVDEAEKQMTLDEYKKQLEEKKRAQQEKLPQFNRRTAGEGEDPKAWQKFTHEYRKKNDNEGSDEEGEEGSGAEDEDEEEEEEEQTSGKKKRITIPLRFEPIDIPRGGSTGFRGGPRRGGGGGPGGDRGRYRDQPHRDDQQRSKSPSQQQSPMPEQTGDYQHDEQQHQQRPYRGGSRGQWSGRGDNRRPYGNSGRGSHGGQNRTRPDPRTPDFTNANDFPVLAKQE